MPAINLPRLKAQAAELAELYDQPARFVHQLSGVLEYYADRTHRPSPSGAEQTIIPAYRVPAQVLDRIAATLSKPAKMDPHGILALADALWAERALEYRLLACTLLGMIAPSPPEPLTDRLQAWAAENQEEPLLDALADQSLARLRVEAQGVFLGWVEGWLGNPALHLQKLGLRALGALLAEPHFEDLPTVFRLLEPLFANAARDLRPELLGLTQGLARRSPQETAHFLRQSCTRDLNPNTAWVIRQCLDDFPAESRAALREAVRGG